MQSEREVPREGAPGLSDAAASGRRSANLREMLPGLNKGWIRLISAVGQSPDVMILLGLVISMAFLIAMPLPFLRIPIGLAYVLFAPGYALVAALLSLQSERSWMVRVGLAFGISISAIPLIVLVFSLLSIPILPTQIMASVHIWVLLFASIALWRRSRSPVVQPALPGGSTAPLRFRRELMPAGPRLLAWASGLAGLAVLLVLFVQFVQSSSAETEFYVLGSQGQARDYASDVRVGIPVSTTIGVVNREATSSEFSIEIWSETRGVNQPKHQLGHVGPISVDHDESVEREVVWEMLSPGDHQTVTFYLLREGDSEPFRELRLTLDVRDLDVQEPRGPGLRTTYRDPR